MLSTSVFDAAALHKPMENCAFRLSPFDDAAYIRQCIYGKKHTLKTAEIDFAYDKEMWTPQGSE